MMVLRSVTAAVLLVLPAVVGGSSHAQVLFSPDCVNKGDYPALGVTLCVRTGDKEQFDPAAFHLNSTFRIPGERREPRVVERAKGDELCGGDRCYGQAMIGWTPEIAACARGVRIGLITSGIDSAHPAFSGAHFSNSNFAPPQTTRGAHWQGTALLALLAGNSKGGVSGLIPDAQFMVADAFFADRDGRPMVDVVTILKALDWMRAQGAHVVLLDAVLPRDALIEHAVANLTKIGAVVVAPASEEGDTAEPNPNVITVMAVNKDMAAYEHASRVARIDLVAPGVDIWTALPGSKYGYVSGNSFAAAHATAALATIPKPEPSLNASEVKDRALAQLPVKDLGVGYGRGFALAAKDCAPGLFPVPPLQMRMPPAHDTSWTETIPRQ